MKFTIDKKQFSSALSRIQGIAKAQSSMPILSNVLIATSPSYDHPQVQLTATDLEVGYTTSLDCSAIDMAGSITLPAKKLYEVVKVAPTSEITFSLNTDNNRVTIGAGEFVTTLAGLDAGDFPQVVAVPGDTLELNSMALLHLLKRVEYAQSSDEQRFNLCGTFLQVVSDDVDGNRLLAASTDGHRLTFDYVPLPGETRAIPGDLLRGIIVSRKGVAELGKFRPDQIIILSFAGNDLSVTSETETVRLRLVDGEFPAFQRMIPARAELIGTIKASRSPLLEAIERVGLLSEGKLCPIDITFVDGKIGLNSENREIGESCDRVTAEINGSSEPRRMNALYFSQALSAWGCDDVDIHLYDGLQPVLLTPSGEDYPLALIMPLRADS